MGRIVAIGGGDLSTLATEPIDRAIVELAEKSKPNVLFVPTASSDSVEYWEVFDRVYGDEYGCQTDVLFLLGPAPSMNLVSDKIRWADIVYVGGGYTLKMMRRWRRLGVDDLLRTAFEEGKVLCGISAGAICWFERGHSDSMSFYSPDDWSYIAVTGMGLIPGFACPHYNGGTDDFPRRHKFHEMLRGRGGHGIAIDDDCAVAFVDDGYSVVPATADAGAYVVTIDRGNVIKRKLPSTSTYLPRRDLFDMA